MYIAKCPSKYFKIQWQWFRNTALRTIAKCERAHYDQTGDMVLVTCSQKWKYFFTHLQQKRNILYIKRVY